MKPASGPGSGGTKVTVSGVDFAGTTSVLFGSVAATSFAVNAAGTSIVADAPAASAGTVDITVTTPLGTSPAIQPDEYTYLGPAVSSVTPVSGPGAGGTKVTIHGSALNGANQVLFGSAAATSFTVNAAGTSITAYAPAALAGTVDITVTTPGGTSAVVPADEFTYLGPAVSSITPVSGPGAGGTKVTIHGSGLNGTTAVLFGSAAATSFTVNAAGTSITAYAPAALAGTVDITVTTPGGTSAVVPADEFTYLGPTVSAVRPASGPSAGDTKVTVTGTDLNGATQVLFGTAAGTGVTVNAAGTSLTAYSPAGSGTVGLTVTTPAGTSPLGPADHFTYN